MKTTFRRLVELLSNKEVGELITRNQIFEELDIHYQQIETSTINRYLMLFKKEKYLIVLKKRKFKQTFQIINQIPEDISSESIRYKRNKSSQLDTTSN